MGATQCLDAVKLTASVGVSVTVNTVDVMADPAGLSPQHNPSPGLTEDSPQEKGKNDPASSSTAGERASWMVRGQRSGPVVDH